MLPVVGVANYLRPLGMELGQMAMAHAPIALTGIAMVAQPEGGQPPQVRVPRAAMRRDPALWRQERKLLATETLVFCAINVGRTRYRETHYSGVCLGVID